MKILCDFHHSSLFYSLKLLFEDRLGHELYRPIGMDWFDKGYWNYTSNNDRQVIDQFLLGQPHEITVGEDGGKFIKIQELFHGYEQKGLTFDQFLNTDIDIVMATIKNHEEVYDRLIKDHKPNAKLIRQEGNNDFAINPICKNVMSSVPPNGISIPEGTNIVYYHQEFDTNLFIYTPPRRYNRITNMMNCLPEWESYNTWLDLLVDLDDFEFKMHGIGGVDGNLDRVEAVAEAIKDSTFIFQLKQGENGGGHLTHNAMAIGRPLICKGSYLKYLFENKILEHGKTCIDLEQSDWLEVLRKYSIPENYEKMSLEIHRRWLNLVSFDKEELKIRTFMENLI